MPSPKQERYFSTFSLSRIEGVGYVIETHLGKNCKNMYEYFRHFTLIESQIDGKDLIESKTNIEGSTVDKFLKRDIDRTKFKIKVLREEWSPYYSSLHFI